MIVAQNVWGTLPTWLLVVLALAGAWRISKGGGGSAVSELSKANEVLTKLNHSLGAEVRDLKVENAKLQERTDLTLALEPVVTRIVEVIAEHETRTVTALAEHEGRAIERHQKQLEASDRQIVILSMMADRLGPDTNGHSVAA